MAFETSYSARVAAALSAAGLLLVNVTTAPPTGAIAVSWMVMVSVSPLKGDEIVTDGVAAVGFDGTTKVPSPLVLNRYATGRSAQSNGLRDHGDRHSIQYPLD
jgi:hypothetical protein